MIKTPSQNDFERIRLLLSTYQDGTGMLLNKQEGNQPITLPGWRDFERTIAIALHGKASEDKHIYDVLIKHNEENGYFYGISCKMRATLHEVDKKNRVTIELSNAAGEFWTMLDPQGINQQNYLRYCNEIGIALINRVKDWHLKVDRKRAGLIISEDSFFLSLQYNSKTYEYQLFQYPVGMPDPRKIDWSWEGRHLCGSSKGRVLVEWYGFSGGQLKYYPTPNDAVWRSERFKLEKLPDNLKDVLQEKASVYFPEKWKQVQ